MIADTLKSSNQKHNQTETLQRYENIKDLSHLIQQRYPIPPEQGMAKIKSSDHITLCYLWLEGIHTFTDKEVTEDSLQISIIRFVLKP